MPPTAVERYYARALNARLEPIMRELGREVMARLPDVVAERDAKLDDARIGSFSFDGLFSAALRKAKSALDASFASKLSKRIEKLTRDHSDRETKRVTHSIVGIDPILDDKRLRKLSRKFAAENAALIKRLPQSYFGAVQKQLRSMVHEGKSLRTISKHLEATFSERIRKGFKNPRRYALLLARDQVHKHAAEVAEERHKELGVEKYEWSTSGDGAVRESHEELDGKTFEWGKAPGGYDPGKDYGCRCTALPVFDDKAIARIRSN